MEGRKRCMALEIRLPAACEAESVFLLLLKGLSEGLWAVYYRVVVLHERKEN